MLPGVSCRERLLEAAGQNAHSTESDRRHSKPLIFTTCMHIRHKPALYIEWSYCRSSLDPNKLVEDLASPSSSVYSSSTDTPTMSTTTLTSPLATAEVCCEHCAMMVMTIDD